MRRLSILLALVAVTYGCGERQAPRNDEAIAVEEASVNEEGEMLYISRCSQCHRMDAEVVGPALRGSLARWGNDTARYKAFIRNSQEVINSGDEYAVKLFERWNKTVMVPNEDLSDAELDALIEYLNQ